MPELPEVETTCRGLAGQLQDATIISAAQYRPDLRLPLPLDLSARLTGLRLQTVRRRAKYILMDFTDNQTLLVHLGMSGRMVVQAIDDQAISHKHDHVVLRWDNGRELRYHDPRRFGLMDFVRTADLAHHTLLHHIGVEPLDQTALTPRYLAQQFHNKKTSLKAILLDQRVIAGLGNIYVSEALFYAGLSPERPAGTVPESTLPLLIRSIRKVLNAAIQAGGSSLRDYVQSDGALGYFQNQFAVYDRAGEQCLNCKSNHAIIQRISQNGRSTFFCLHCQS